MKNVLLITIMLLICANGYAQTLNFTSANPQPNLMEAYAGTFASGDIDGDGDIDLFMTGITPQPQTKLYFNNGTGNFTEATHSFPRASTSQAILKDLDSDGDLDLFFSGTNQLQQNFTNIYRNNGAGVFTQVPNNAIPIIPKGAAIADVDNDGDQDIVISTSSVANVYLNNGNAVFTAQSNSVFTPVNGVVRFIDIEKDGDQDVIISGGSTIKLYQNNGSGIFTLNTNSTFAALSGEDIDVADTDNDGDLDFLINGNTQNLLYINNGSGVFTQVATTLQQTFGGQNAFTDLDKDGDQDLLIVGTQAGGLPNIYNIVYKNTGNNVFVQTQILGGEYIADCVIDDFNNDGLKDIIIQWFANRTNVYWNTTTALPVELISFRAITFGSEVVLKWVTVSEVNNEVFEIEESQDGRKFQKIGAVAGQGNTLAQQEYAFEVENPRNGISYYRLKQIDFDGQFEYSELVSVNFKGKNEEIGGFYPNPSKTGMVNLDYTAQNDDEIVVSIFDIAGRLVTSQIQQVSSGDNQLSFDFSELNTGIYVAKIGHEINAIHLKIIIE